MKGKRTLFLIVISITTLCVIVGFFKGYDTVWSIWNFPIITPHFADLRNLTGGQSRYQWVMIPYIIIQAILGKGR